MTRCIALAAVVLASFSAVASARLLRKIDCSVDPIVDPEFEDKGSTVVQMYCDSVDCPSGYSSIDYAQHVKCTKGKTCSTYNCCDKLCMTYFCPNEYIEDPNESNNKCEDSKCTTSQCCRYYPSKKCSSYRCPTGYVLVDKASSRTCSNRKCTTEWCCVTDPGES